jgi:hypothetical protein
MTTPVTTLKDRINGLLKQGTWFGVDEAIDLLISETGKGKTLDPFVDPDRLLWNYAFHYLLSVGLRLEALTTFHAFLDCCYSLQEEHQERIHKGTPLFWLGLVYHMIGQSEQSRKYTILAFIEDVINSRGSTIQGIIKSPASIVLRRTYRMRVPEIESLQGFILGKPAEEKIFYPEETLLSWITQNERSQNLLIARNREESLYKANLPYLQKLVKNAFEDSTGKGLELLATYLFSCIDGFEPIPRKATTAFHFDLVVRNLVRDHPLVESFGEYIGVECKNVSTTVTAQQLDHFIHKLRLHDIKCGIVFTNKGISGIKHKGLAFGKSIQIKTLNRDGIVIFDITKSDLERISNGENPLSMLLRKYEDIRFM